MMGKAIPVTVRKVYKALPIRTAIHTLLYSLTIVLTRKIQRTDSVGILYNVLPAQISAHLIVFTDCCADTQDPAH